MRVLLPLACQRQGMLPLACQRQGMLRLSPHQMQELLLRAR
jgi:hypothetical protein